MNTEKLSSPEPFYLMLSRKLVLLFLLMVTSAIGWVALLLQIRQNIPLLTFVLTDAALGLVAGFSVRWVIPKKSLFLRICAAIAFITGCLALLGWFTGWGFGIDLLRAGRTRIDWWDIGQILLATSFSLLALYAWQNPQRTLADAQSPISEEMPTIRRKPQKRPARAPKPKPAPPAESQPVQPDPPSVALPPLKTKRQRIDHSRPKLVMLSQEEHRCPYCLEVIDPNDKRGVVECSICHALHHADCWAITGTCQVPHFNA